MHPELALDCEQTGSIRTLRSSVYFKPFLTKFVCLEAAKYKIKFTTFLHQPMHHNLLVKAGAQVGSSATHWVPEGKTSTTFQRLSSKLSTPLAACPHSTAAKQRRGTAAPPSRDPSACPSHPSQRQEQGPQPPSALLINPRRYSLTAWARASHAALSKPPSLCCAVEMLLPFLFYFLAETLLSAILLLLCKWPEMIF